MSTRSCACLQLQMKHNKNKAANFAALLTLLGSWTKPLVKWQLHKTKLEGETQPNIVIRIPQLLVVADRHSATSGLVIAVATTCHTARAIFCHPTISNINHLESTAVPKHFIHLGHFGGVETAQVKTRYCFAGREHACLIGHFIGVRYWV